MADTHWDDEWDQAEPDRFDDLPPDDLPPDTLADEPDNAPDDSSDSFEVRTFDTSQLQRARRGQATKPKFPEIPVVRAEVDDDDDFTALTVDPYGESAPAARTQLPEPRVNRVPPAAPGRSLSPSASPARTTAHPSTRSQARPRPRRAKTRKPPSAFWITLRTFFIVLVAAVLVSTIFSLWTQPSFFTDEFRAGLNQVQATQRVVNIQPSPLPTETREIKIGIVAGHTGPPLQEGLPEDPGAVCDDGLTERRINEAVAREVVAALRRDGYTVDLLEEFDERLAGYQADLLVSIHTNDCQDYGAAGTGYNVATAQSRQTTAGQDERLLNCLVTQYGATTGLPRHQGLTYDMTEYHTFGEVAVDTPTAIIEIGFMRNDRPMLLNQQDLIAQGIANGVRCFLRPDLYSEVSG
ncbi:MAG: N-acetylmuramoyl-L-alanine amidase [Anaerolineae bacterium]|nr:N-acetylmuramoyl-L-alanine amidase [Anaerolineae bacterium]